MAKKGTLSLNDLVENAFVRLFVHLEVRGLLSFVGVATLIAVNLDAGPMVCSVRPMQTTTASLFSCRQGSPSYQSFAFKVFVTQCLCSCSVFCAHASKS